MRKDSFSVTFPEKNSLNTDVPKGKIKVIDSLWTFLVATAFLGPFALPLLWRNPRFKVQTKVIGSIAVLLFTYFLMKFAAEFIGDQVKVLDELNTL